MYSKSDITSLLMPRSDNSGSEEEAKTRILYLVSLQSYPVDQNDEELSKTHCGIDHVGTTPVNSRTAYEDSNYIVSTNHLLDEFEWNYDFVNPITPQQINLRVTTNFKIQHRSSTTRPNATIVDNFEKSQKYCPYHYNSTLASLMPSCALRTSEVSVISVSGSNLILLPKNELETQAKSVLYARTWPYFQSLGNSSNNTTINRIGLGEHFSYPWHRFAASCICRITPIASGVII